MLLLSCQEEREIPIPPNRFPQTPKRIRASQIPRPEIYLLFPLTTRLSPLTCIDWAYTLVRGYVQYSLQVTVAYERLVLRPPDVRSDGQVVAREARARKRTIRRHRRVTRCV